MLIQTFEIRNKKIDRKVYLFALLIFFQLILTARGLRDLNDASWYHPSYEEKAALVTGHYITDHPILLVSFPEPYYYFLHYDTQSIIDTYPYLYIPRTLDNRTILIVEDMGMHDVFPNFTKILDTKLKKYKTTTFYINERYHYANRSIAENAPIILYSIPLGELKKILGQNQ